MDGFWLGLLAGIASSAIAGSLGIVGVLLTNRAQRQREEVAHRAASERDASAQQVTISMEETRKRGEREHELRRALANLSKSLRRAEANYGRGLTSSSEITFDSDFLDVQWRVGRLSRDYAKNVERELDRAQAQIQAGFVGDGMARLDVLIRVLQDWALFSPQPLEIPSPPGHQMHAGANSPGDVV